MSKSKESAPITTRGIAMESDICRILTVNGGPSSIKFALFEACALMRRVLCGGIERIGQPDATFEVTGVDPTADVSWLLRHRAALQRWRR